MDTQTPPETNEMDTRAGIGLGGLDDNDIADSMAAFDKAQESAKTTPSNAIKTGMKSQKIEKKFKS